MSSIYAPIIAAVFKPFLLKILPSLFEDFDKLECDFARVNIDTGNVDLGVMVPFKLKSSKQWDILEGIENVKVMGMRTDRSQATELISLLTIERFPTKTVITAHTKLEEVGDVNIEYDNKQIWAEQKKQALTEQKKLGPSTDQKLLS